MEAETRQAGLLAIAPSSNEQEGLKMKCLFKVPLGSKELR